MRLIPRMITNKRRIPVQEKYSFPGDDPYESKNIKSLLMENGILKVVTIIIRFRRK